MQRRKLITLLGGAFTAWPLVVSAQQPSGARRIGILVPSSEGDALAQARVNAFRAGLAELGWKEGQTATFVVRYVGQSPDRDAELAAELIRANAEVIITSGTQLIQAAQSASQKIPVVMAGSGDPVGAGVVASIVRPSGRVTGLSLVTPELAAKRLQMTKEILPGLTNIAIIWNSNNASVTLRFRETESAANLMGLKLQSIEVLQVADFERGLQAAAEAGAQALLTTEDTLVFNQRALVLSLAKRYRLPAISGLRQFADAGGLFSYGPNILDLWRRAAGYVDKVLKGADPADLPIEQPTRFELILNLKTARALGLSMPPSLLGIADEVIE
jgi:putative ABC transport system substrate-binding protein